MSSAPSPQVPRRLTALDASFLYLEREGFPMHVGSLATFEGGPLRDRKGRLREADLRRLIDARMPASGRWRLEQPIGGGRPYWVVDPDFDIANHVLFTRVEAPDDDHLHATVAELHQRLLDRRRPLWEIWFVDGLAGGRVALVQKIHHALVDGLAGVDVGTAVLDLGPAGWPDTAPGPDVDAPSGLPLRLALTSRELVTRAGQAYRVATSPLAILSHASTRRRLGDVGRGLRAFVPHAIAPRTALNEPVGTHRSYATFSTTLDEARAIRGPLGGTVNDVILAVVTSAIRSVLTERGADCPPVIHTLVPVADRSPDQRGDVGNRVAAMIVGLPVGEASPLARYEAIRDATKRLKDSGEPALTASLLGAVDFLPEPAAVLLSRLVHRQPFVNVVVTNVPGPPIPLYLAGSLMLDVFPVVPLAGNLSLSVSILSYGNQLNVGVVADTDRWPDLNRLVSALDAGLRELAEVVRPTAHLEAS